MLGEGEHIADAIAGCFACGTRRSSTFHRGPVIYDMEWAFTLWGFMPGAPADLVAYRRPLFAGVRPRLLPPAGGGRRRRGGSARS